MSVLAGFLDNGNRDPDLGSKKYENENQPKQSKGSGNSYIHWKEGCRLQ